MFGDSIHCVFSLIARAPELSNQASAKLSSDSYVDMCCCARYVTHKCLAAIVRGRFTTSLTQSQTFDSTASKSRMMSSSTLRAERSLSLYCQFLGHFLVFLCKFVQSSCHSSGNRRQHVSKHFLYILKVLSFTHGRLRKYCVQFVNFPT